MTSSEFTECSPGVWEFTGSKYPWMPCDDEVLDRMDPELRRFIVKVVSAFEKRHIVVPECDWSNINRSQWKECEPGVWRHDERL